MHTRVTAILVARNGEQYLERTLGGIAQQSRRPDSLVFVDAGSSDSTPKILATGNPTQFITTGRLPFGSAVSHAIEIAQPGEVDGWLWLLAHDNAPSRGALAALLSAVEIAPSVAVAGPKLMRWDAPDVIAEYGETVTRLGASLALVAGELDQAQHDRKSDLLAVAASGMLVRRSVWNALGGFDPSLPDVDAALDFSIRARLAGHRVVGVPAARVLSDGGPESFARKPSQGSTARATRAAQLHRRMTYAPIAALPLHWLSILPLAIVRAAWHLIGKRPGVIPGEFRAALAAIFDGGVSASRRNLARGRVLGWGAIAPLRMPWGEVRELRAHQKSLVVNPVGEEVVLRQRPSFFSSGGAWIVLLMAALGVIAFGSFLGATALKGGGLAPLGSSVSALWNNIGFGWRGIADGFLGAADPFAAVVAVIGSITSWAPSTSIVVLYLVAIPLAALGAWHGAARFSERGWAPAVAAVLWSLAPPFLASLSGGHLGAVLVHLLLPWFLIALVGSARSWAAAAAAGLILAGLTASAPVLAPVLLLAWLVWMLAHARITYRLIGIPVLSVVLFAPLIVDQVIRGNWLAIFADPGVPAVNETPSAWQLALGSAGGASDGWAAVAGALGLPSAAAPIICAVLLVPLAGLVLLSLTVQGSRRALVPLAVAFAGFVTAVASTHISVTSVESATTIIWPGSGLSLFWLGLVGAVVVTLEALGRAVVVPALVVALASGIAGMPLLFSVAAGTADVSASSGRMLPAFVAAEAATDPDIGTLELTAQDDGGLAAVVHRGEGTTLDDQSTIAASSSGITDEQQRIAELAANLVSTSGLDATAELEDLQIAFILVPDTATGDGVATRVRTTETLDADAHLTAIGQTDFGYLWYFDEMPQHALPDRPGPADTALGVTILLVQGIVLAVTVLLAVPTSGRRRGRPAATRDEPAPTFEEDDND